VGGTEQSRKIKTQAIQAGADFAVALIYSITHTDIPSLQCFNTVEWVTGRASGLLKI